MVDGTFLVSRIKLLIRCYKLREKKTFHIKTACKWVMHSSLWNSNRHDIEIILKLTSILRFNRKVVGLIYSNDDDLFYLIYENIHEINAHGSKLLFALQDILMYDKIITTKRCTFIR